MGRRGRERGRIPRADAGRPNSHAPPLSSAPPPLGPGTARDQTSLPDPPTFQKNPRSYDKFVLPDGVKKVTHARDTRVEHAATFTLQREDHTVGNLVRTALHRDGEVTFAGYRVPHPLEHVVVVKVATRGRRTPKAVLSRCLADLADAVEDARGAFEAAVSGAGGGGGGGGGY